MRFDSDILGLPKGTETLLTELVHIRTGIFFDSAKVDLLMDKLSPLIVRRGFNSFLDYYYFLKYDDSGPAEWIQVMNAITVGETFFWREIDQVRALTQTIVPNWVAAHPGRTLRIWSAACATGEEPLTIAIALHEAGWFDRASIEIVGTDGSSTAIVKAIAGVYRERSFRHLTSDRRDRYFVQDSPTTWSILPSLQSRVRFAVANLMNESEIAPLATADVIFCRNVFIYFSETTVARTVRTFARYMPHGGSLFVGVAESLLRLTTDFELHEVGNAFVYEKEKESRGR
jgi:chemotaxis protein methyltransferase CheR